jgi:hypothetical protein
MLCRVPYFAVLVSLLNNTSVEASEAIALDCGRRLNAALEQKTKSTPGKSLSHNGVAKTVLRSALYTSPTLSYSTFLRSMPAVDGMLRSLMLCLPCANTNKA